MRALRSPRIDGGRAQTAGAGKRDDGERHKKFFCSAVTPAISDVLRPAARSPFSDHLLGVEENLPWSRRRP